MSSNQFEGSVIGIEVLSNSESHKSGVISGEEIFLSWTEWPVINLIEFFKSFLIELLPGPLDNMEGGDSIVDKFEECIS